MWEGRFKSCLAQSEDYVLACYRYIELNPVRADMVSHPRAYRWSSYRANAYGKEDLLLTRHDEYLRLGKNDDERKHNYRELFKVHMDAELAERITKTTNGNFVLGKGRFVEEIEQALGRRAMPRKPSRPVRGER